MKPNSGLRRNSLSCAFSGVSMMRSPIGSTPAPSPSSVRNIPFWGLVFATVAPFTTVIQGAGIAVEFAVRRPCRPSSSVRSASWARYGLSRIGRFPGLRKSIICCMKIFVGEASDMSASRTALPWDSGTGCRHTPVAARISLPWRRSPASPDGPLGTSGRTEYQLAICARVNEVRPGNGVQRDVIVQHLLRSGLRGWSSGWHRRCEAIGPWWPYRRLAPLWQPRTPKPLRLPTILSSSPPFSLSPHLVWGSEVRIISAASLKCGLLNRSHTGQ